MNDADDDFRVDTGDDDRISKEEFTSDELKEAMEKVKDCDLLQNPLRCVTCSYFV